MVVGVITGVGADQYVFSDRSTGLNVGGARESG
jgi:hypothetical protein